MKRWLLRGLVGVVAVLALWLILGLVAGWIVSGTGKDSLTTALSAKLGVTVSVTAGRFDLGQWFRLRPAISLDQVAIGNPAGFRTEHLLTARKLVAQVELLPLLSKSIRVRSLVLEAPRIVIERNGAGDTNLAAVLRALSSNPQANVASSAGAGAGPSGVTLSIKELRIISGELVAAETRAGKARDSTLVDNLELRVLGLQPDAAARLELEARLFRGRASRLSLAAQAGPFASDSLPLEGRLSLTVAPVEIPAPLRQEQFGKLLGAPGEKGRAKLEASLKGDAYRVLSGSGRMSLSDILVGKDAQHLLVLAGEAPLTVSCARLMSDPAFRFKITGARLRLGEGEWTGGGEVELRGSLIRGSSKGALRSVEINQMLSSFTEAEQKIFGVMEAPSYSIQFAGRNADELRDSLNGETHLSVSNGRVAALDLLASIRQALEGSRQEAAAAEGNTPFTTLAADVQVGQRKLALSGINLNSPALRLTGNGSIGFDGALALNLEAPVSGQLGEMLTRLTRTTPGTETKLPVLVTGTVDSPRVRPDVRALAGRGVRGLVESFLKKRAK